MRREERERETTEAAPSVGSVHTVAIEESLLLHCLPSPQPTVHTNLHCTLYIIVPLALTELLKGVLVCLVIISRACKHSHMFVPSNGLFYAMLPVKICLLGPNTRRATLWLWKGEEEEGQNKKNVCWSGGNYLREKLLINNTPNWRHLALNACTYYCSEHEHCTCTLCAQCALAVKV